MKALNTLLLAAGVLCAVGSPEQLFSMQPEIAAIATPDERTCSVCYNPYTVENPRTKLEGCVCPDPDFCLNCLKEWHIDRKGTTCMMCRQEVNPTQLMVPLNKVQKMRAYATLASHGALFGLVASLYPFYHPRGYSIFYLT